MTPIDQTLFYVEGKSRGNCLQAAVASIMSFPLSDVPNFIEVANGDACKFWDAFHAFFVDHGYIALGMPKNWVPDCYYLAHGKSERGCSHSVVYRAGKLAHDPHPSRLGIISVDHAHLIVPINIGGKP